MKKLASIFVCISLISTLIVNGFAVTENTLACEEEIAQHYEYFTIELTTNQPLSCAEGNLFDIQQQNITNILTAIDYVNSLDLDENGYSEMQMLWSK